MTAKTKQEPILFSPVAIPRNSEEQKRNSLHYPVKE